MVGGSFVLRRELHEGWSPTDIYEIYETLITVRMNHGGVFTGLPGRRYVNGNVDFIDLVNTEGLSLHEFDKMVLALGYDRDEVKFYHFLIPQSDLDTGLRPLVNNQDVLNFLRYAPVSGPWNDQCIVDVRARTCSCRQWELTGIPCKHSVATNWNMAANGSDVVPESWVDNSYRLSVTP
ncbi:hypothetical protein L6452_11494 [Arctium lappa]|uniref:Uncharacterized protein n=1 Tax=Arctium lappa TaxID=4217 RepID=A0ACB9DPE9_ARCLA|nr:hypothetical protein L6452_11494 [Arctium lappa]